MATAEQFATLKHFTPDEFNHPERLHFPLLLLLDAIREELGAPLFVTSDFRDYIPPGGASESLHMYGRAVDLRWPASAEVRFRFVSVVMRLPTPPGDGGVELGLEAGALGGPHIHLGLWPAGHPPTLFVR